MSKNDVIKYLANNHIIEDIIQNICGDFDDDLKDLSQDIYIDLYTKSEKKLIDLYNNQQLKFFITRIVFNNVFSHTSRFYTQYKKNKNNKISLDDLDYDRY